MRQQIKQIIDSNWFFPILLLNYGLFYILFAETYPANEGFGTDGSVYRSLVESFDKSVFYDSFFIHRIFPSAIIRICLSLFHLDPSATNIFYSFEILNLLAIFISAIFLKQILIHFNITFKKQILCYILMYSSFALIKWPFYFPVMTDSTAFCLSVLLLYFYLKDKVAGIILITLLLAFTWPMGYYQGIILLALPYKQLAFIRHSAKWNVIIRAASVFFYLAIFTLLIVINGADTNLIFIPKIDRSLLFLTVIFMALFYLGFSFLFLNAEFFNIKEFYNSLKPGRILLSVMVFTGVTLFIYFLNVPASSIYKMSTILENPIVHSSVRPLLTHVAHFTFFGLAFCLIVIFWKRIAELISIQGRGLVIAVALNLYLFGIMPESRMLINLFPWMIIFLIASVNKFSFSDLFYVLLSILCLAASRIWLYINYDLDPVSGTAVDKNGSLDFPNQKFYMNIGPWMSEYAVFIQGIFMIICFGILFISIFRVTKVENKLKIKNRFNQRGENA